MKRANIQIQEPVCSLCGDIIFSCDVCTKKLNKDGTNIFCYSLDGFWHLCSKKCATKFMKIPQIELNEKNN